MASEDTLLGNDLRLQIGDGNSPETFIDFCAANDVGGLGESKPQVDVTTLCDLARVFRGGLPEGAEVTVQANLIQGDAQTRALFQNYKDDDIVNFRLNIPSVTPAEYFMFSAAILGWAIQAPVGDKAQMTFTLKISGGVEWVYES
jgi:hypothetical protein